MSDRDNAVMDGSGAHYEDDPDEYDYRTLTEREEVFLEASVAVWREIDRLDAEPGGYKGLDEGTALRIAERKAWNAYRDKLDEIDASIRAAATHEGVENR